jgi:FkbM family methyltransferase
MIITEHFFRTLPDFKGKMRLAKLFFRNRMKNGKEIVVKGRLACKYKLPNLDEFLAQQIFVNGIYEPDTHSFLVQKIPHNGVFLDLGANIGTIAIPLCKARPDIRCIAVEASPWIYEYLKFNVEANHLHHQIILVNKAISDTEKGKLPFYSPVDQFGKGSFAPVFTDQAVEVDTITIDTLLKEFAIQKVSTVKIDIEGFEYFAFQGGKNLFSAEDGPDIIFEFVDWAEELAGVAKGSAQKILRQFGYQLCLMNNDELTPIEEIVIKGNDLFFASKKQANSKK